MPKKWWAALVVAVVVACAFGAGYMVGSNNSIHEGLYAAGCSTGEAVATCMVGNVGYDFRSAVNWTDSSGVGHSDSWPDCLPKMAEVKAVRFAGAWLPTGENSRAATVVWVDCQKH